MITSLVQAHSPTVRRNQGAHEDGPGEGRDVLPLYVDCPSPTRPTGYSHLALWQMCQSYFCQTTMVMIPTCHLYQVLQQRRWVVLRNQKHKYGNVNNVVLLNHVVRYLGECVPCPMCCVGRKPLLRWTLRNIDVESMEVRGRRQYTR